MTGGDKKSRLEKVVSKVLRSTSDARGSGSPLPDAPGGSHEVTGVGNKKSRLEKSAFFWSGKRGSDPRP